MQAAENKPAAETRTYTFSLKTVHVINTFSPNSDSGFAAFAVNLNRSQTDVGVELAGIGDLHNGDIQQIGSLTINVPALTTKTDVYIAFYIANVGYAPDGKHIASIGVGDILYSSLKHGLNGPIESAFQGYPRKPSANVWPSKRTKFANNDSPHLCNGVAAADLFLLEGSTIFRTINTIGTPYDFQFERYHNTPQPSGTLNCQGSEYRIIMSVTRIS